MIKRIVTEHKSFLFILLAIVIASYVANTFIKYNTILLGGEYIFSFDHLGHVQNLLNDPRSSLAEDNTNCFDCPDFYHYSRWYSLFKIGFHATAQLIHLHPFIFLILSMVLTQLTSLYIFTRTVFTKFSLLPFLIASFVFIFYPYKYSLLIETHDGLLYSNMLLYITVLVATFKNISKFTTKRAMLAGIGTGIVFSFFLGLNIAFLPIAIYTSLIIALIYRKELLKKTKNLFLYAGALTVPVLLLNIPILSSLIQYGNTRHYEGYISFNFIDSFMSGLSIAQTHPHIIIAFACLFLFCFIYAPIKWKLKLWMLFTYIFIGLMITGTNSPINIYGWMFDYMPLMDSLRSTYRLMFFELFILFILMYFTLRKLYSGNIVQLLIFGIIFALFVYLPLQHIYLHKDYFFKSSLPEEYFNAQAYLNSTNEKKIYFPPRTPLFHSIATDYYWGDPNYKESILLYKNPYTSLLPIKNLVQFERFPYLLSPDYLELHYFTDLTSPAENVINALELRGVKYVIVDKNYKWGENYPNFSIEEFIKLAEVDRAFGNIIILRLKDKSNECKKGYGKISLEYCTSTSRDTVLIDKTRQEFDLEVHPEEIGEKLNIRKNSIYTKSVLDPIIHQSFVDNKVLFGRETMQVFGDQKNVFSTNTLEKGKYRIYVSLYKYTDKEMLMKEANLVIRSGGKEIKSISPYTDKPGIYWESADIEINEPQNIFINVEKEGYIIITAVPILEKLQ